MAGPSGGPVETAMDLELCGWPGMACVAAGLVARRYTSDEWEPASRHPAHAVRSRSFTHALARVGLLCLDMEGCAPL